MLLLVDRTTQYTQRDKKLLRNAVDTLYRELGTGDRLIVQTIAGEWTKSEILFNTCIPGCSSTGFLDWLFSVCNTVRAKRDLIRQKTALAEKLQELTNNRRSFPHSALARTIEAATQRIHERARQRHTVQPLATLAIFSDMIQNTGYMSAQDIKQWPPRKSLRRFREHGITPALDGVTVRVFGFGRSQDAHRAALSSSVQQRVANAWRGFFRRAGAQKVEIGLHLR